MRTENLHCVVLKLQRHRFTKKTCFHHNQPLSSAAAGAALCSIDPIPLRNIVHSKTLVGRLLKGSLLHPNEFSELDLWVLY